MVLVAVVEADQMASQPLVELLVLGVQDQEDQVEPKISRSY